VVEIKKENDGFCFVVRSGQGQILLQSVEFASKEDLEACMREVRLGLGNPACFERMTNHNGKFRFSLRNPKGRVLGHSALYSSEAGMENGIKNFLTALSRDDLA
jgi:uncharacterized protein YegP (UPF0339 family)